MTSLQPFRSGEKTGPVLIYVGGEAALTSSAVTRGFIVELAQEFKAVAHFSSSFTRIHLGFDSKILN